MPARKKPIIAPVIKGAEDVGPEILAQSIIDISEGMKRITNSRLSRRALLVLIKAETGVSHAMIDKVLKSLEGLATAYVKPWNPRGK